VKVVVNMGDQKSSSIVSSTSSLEKRLDDIGDSHVEQRRSSFMQLFNNSPSSPTDSEEEPRPKKAMGTSMNKESEEYLRKRARNNLAVKKSRDRSKKRILETQERVEQLTKDNVELNQKVALLSKELSVLRALFTNGGFTVPCNLQIVAQKSSNVPESQKESHEELPKSYLTANKQQQGHISPSAPSTLTHTSVIRSPATSSRPCHGVILVTEPGKMNLDIQAGIQFKDEEDNVI